MSAEKMSSSQLVLQNVTLVRTLEGGDIVRNTMLPEIALLLCGYGTLNGQEVVSARIEWGDVNAREWDMGGIITKLECA
jgi:hypothetical protein